MGRARTLCSSKAADAEGPSLVLAGQVGDEPLCKGCLGRGLVSLGDCSIFVRCRLHRSTPTVLASCLKLRFCHLVGHANNLLLWLHVTRQQAGSSTSKQQLPCAGFAYLHEMSLQSRHAVIELLDLRSDGRQLPGSALQLSIRISKRCALRCHNLCDSGTSAIGATVQRRTCWSKPLTC